MQKVILDQRYDMFILCCVLHHEIHANISILHRVDENVQAFEGRKENFIHDLLHRVKSPREQTLEACVQKVDASIEQIKGCYAGI